MSTLDTVRFDLGGRWKAFDGVFKQKVAAISETGLDGEETRIWSRFLTHEESDLRIGGTVEAPSWCEVSLPKLLYGHNGRLLRPSHVEAAMDNLRGLLEVAIDYLNFDRLTRADLALHLPVKACDAIASLRGTRHPAVRSMPREFFETGLEWFGSQVVIRLYDKGVEQNGVTCDIMRLEFQLRSKALAKRAPLFCDGEFALDNIRQVFRDLVAKFEPRKLLKPGSVVEFLAMLVSDQLAFNDGRSCFEVYCGMKGSARYRNDLRRQVQRCRPPLFILNLLQFVPEMDWPEFIDVNEEAFAEEGAA